MFLSFVVFTNKKFVFIFFYFKGNSSADLSVLYIYLLCVGKFLFDNFEDFFLLKS